MVWLFSSSGVNGHHSRSNKTRLLNDMTKHEGKSRMDALLLWFFFLFVLVCFLYPIPAIRLFGIGQRRIDNVAEIGFHVRGLLKVKQYSIANCRNKCVDSVVILGEYPG